VVNITEKVYLNGELLPYEEANIGVEDRGYQFADGVYEVIEIIEGKPYAMAPHLDRMDMGAKELNLNIPGGIDKIKEDALHYIESIHHEDVKKASLYIQITRGVSERYHPQPKKYSPNILMIIREFEGLDESNYINGIRTVTMPDDRWSKCFIKSISLLPNTLAKTKALEKNAFEATYIRDGYVMEGSHTNFFGVKDGRIITPPATNYILNGVTRRTILKVLKEADISCAEHFIKKEELYELDEAFLSGTLIDVVPIVKIDDKEIGDGKPGEKTKRLMKLFKRYKKNKLN